MEKAFLEKELLTDFSKNQMLRLSDKIGDDEKSFAQLMEIVFHGDKNVCYKGAWLMSYCFDKNPHLLKPYIKPLIKNLKKDIPNAVQRNTLRVLQSTLIPKPLQGEVVNVCLKILENAKELPANKAFSLTIMFNLCKDNPELKNDLKFIIEEQIPYATPAFKSRANHILKNWMKA